MMINEFIGKVAGGEISSIDIRKFFVGLSDLDKSDLLQDMFIESLADGLSGHNNEEQRLADAIKMLCDVFGWCYETDKRKYIHKPTQEQEQANSGQTTDAQSHNPEPQQEQQRIEQTASTILTINNTDKEKWVFGNALQKQYMSLDNGSYKWTLTKSLLAYMCGRLYCGDRIKEDESDYSKEYIKGSTQMPAQEVKALFAVDVASNRYSIKTPPRNSWKVDELFKSNGASR